MKIKEIIEKCVHPQFPDAVVRAPLPCWDSSTLVGATITVPKMMGRVMCDQIVTFQFQPVEVKDISTIQRRTLLALNIIHLNVISTFRPKAKGGFVSAVEAAGHGGEAAPERINAGAGGAAA